jgi:chromosome segregation ATPase
MEKFGFQKRHILSERVEKARDAQVDAKEQFQSAYDQFSALTRFTGGDLEEIYRNLAREFKQCEEKADDVSKRIDTVEEVAEDLFAEWEEELLQYSNQALRDDSRSQMMNTRRQYEQLLRAMRRAEAKIEPVQGAFRDQVLFLKHNLNAQAISSLKGELYKVESSVSQLISEMESSIAEADAFIATIQE